MTTKEVTPQVALARYRKNPHAVWHKGPWDRRTANPKHAANRVYEGPCRVAIDYSGPRLAKADPVFTMGSCFARELERALMQCGANVLSVDVAAMSGAGFSDTAAEIRFGFLHRFTPRAMWQEFMAAFGALPGWQEDRSLIIPHAGGYEDLNYWPIPEADQSLAATLRRRKVAHELVRRAASAKLVVLSLGLTESWRQRSSGFYLNGFSTSLARDDDYCLDLISVPETVQCLEEVHQLLTRVHEGDFQLVVTVSPIPLQTTFTSKDVIVANMDSKSTLRAAATAFCERHTNTHYFPSYEIVTHSGQTAAWRPDRSHVHPDLVTGIVGQFMDAYYVPETRATVRQSSPSLPRRRKTAKTA